MVITRLIGVLVGVVGIVVLASGVYGYQRYQESRLEGLWFEESLPAVTITMSPNKVMVERIGALGTGVTDWHADLNNIYEVDKTGVTYKRPYRLDGNRLYLRDSDKESEPYRVFHRAPDLR